MLLGLFLLETLVVLLNALIFGRCLMIVYSISFDLFGVRCFALWICWFVVSVYLMF